MNRIDEKFTALRKENKKALVAFLTVGDPDTDFSKKAMLAMQNEGVDIIDIGVPFSDPAADGPVIQLADERAIKKGTDIFKVFETVEAVRSEINVPMVLHLYYNVILQYGAEKFFEKCRQTGIDGVIIPDLPYEENGDIDTYTEKYGVYKINCISLTADERIKAIAENSKGFLYCVSSSDDVDGEVFADSVKKYSDIPLCAGFDITDGETVRKYAKYFDGAVVLNPTVEAVASGNSDGERLDNLTAKLRDLKAGL